MKQLIEDQINGDPELQYEGPGMNSPWLSWGAYLWADGTTPRSDGLVWLCPEDFGADGVHPSMTGREKVAQLLLDHFTTDSTSCPWFLDNCDLATDLQEQASGAFSIRYDLANERVDVLHDMAGQVQATIHDHLGRPVSNLISDDGMIRINTPHLRSGVYVVSWSDVTGRTARSSFVVFR